MLTKEIIILVATLTENDFSKIKKKLLFFSLLLQRRLTFRYRCCFLFLIDVIHRFLYFNKLTVASGQMLSPPHIVRTRRAVHRTLNQTEKWRSILARTGTFPPMCLVRFYLIVKIVIYLYTHKNISYGLNKKIIKCCD